MRRLLAFVLLLTAVPLIAETRHEIHKIEFRSRVPANILLTQSALAEDRTYTDDELQLAVARLRRLPFVYSAMYTIDGSTLVVEVVDEYRVFAHFDALVQGLNSTGTGYGFLNTEVGGRYEMKWGGIIEGSVGTVAQQHLHENSWTLAYQQYGVGGTRAFATFGASRGSANDSISPHVLIGYPLTLRQTVSIVASREGHSEGQTFGTLGHYTQTSRIKALAAQWQWDTTNDPLFATRGSAFGLAQGINRAADFYESVSSTGLTQFVNDSQTNMSTNHATAAKFWPIGRGAFTASLDNEYARGHINFRSSLADPYARMSRSTRQTTATVGWAYNFFDSLESAHRNRLEFGVGIVDFNDTTSRGSQKEHYRNVQLGYALRARWGTVHFVGSYLSD